jgi:hypothetical protein
MAQSEQLQSHTCRRGHELDQSTAVFHRAKKTTLAESKYRLTTKREELHLIVAVTLPQ